MYTRIPAHTHTDKERETHTHAFTVHTSNFVQKLSIVKPFPFPHLCSPFHTVGVLS